MFDRDVMFPKYCKNAESITADFDPTVPMDKKLMRKSNDTKQYIDDHSYFYLGYIVSNEVELLTLVEAYSAYAQRGEKLPSEIPVENGKGSFGSNVLLRLCEPNAAVAALTGRGVPEDGLRARLGSVPVFIERPGHYRKSGGWVEFLSSTQKGAHAEFRQYPGEFPMTKNCIDALTGLDALEPK